MTRCDIYLDDYIHTRRMYQTLYYLEDILVDKIQDAIFLQYEWSSPLHEAYLLVLEFLWVEQMGMMGK